MHKASKESLGIKIMATYEVVDNQDDNIDNRVIDTYGTAQFKLDAHTHCTRKQKYTYSVRTNMNMHFWLIYTQKKIPCV